MAKAPETFEKCPRCKTRPATAGRNRWCSECNAEYQREYQAGREDRAEGRGFARGIESMRQAVQAHFEQFRFAHFAGLEISKMVGTIPAPRFQEQAAEPTEPEPAANAG